MGLGYNTVFNFIGSPKPLPATFFKLIMPKIERLPANLQEVLNSRALFAEYTLCLNRLT